MFACPPTCSLKPHTAKRIAWPRATPPSAEQAGDYPGALALALDWLNREPHLEEAHRLVMRLHCLHHAAKAAWARDQVVAFVGEAGLLEHAQLQPVLLAPLDIDAMVASRRPRAWHRLPLE